MTRQKLLVACILAGFLLLTLGRYWATAQIQDGWTSPIRLSTGKGNATEASLVEDSYGYVHAFWAETPDGGDPLIQYARYDGRNWTTPVDILAGDSLGIVQNISVAIAPDNTIHLVWSAGQTGPVFHIQAPAHDALSAQSWTEPFRIPVPAGFVALQVDAHDVLHLLYVRGIGADVGVFYTRSEDQGISWSAPVWLDPDILSDRQPAWLQFRMDEQGGLHASWYYLSLSGAGGDWVRYTHSLDGGENWVTPITIDQLTEREVAEAERLDDAYPTLAVAGDTVHIMWAGGKANYRHHRYSTDRGLTWSEETDLFGTLNGQAGDGMAVDGNGRIHYFGQIRFPQAIYHSVWDGEGWTAPTMVYLIRANDGEEIEAGRIHAHRTYPIVHNGNELLLTFTDPPPEPGRRLFFTSLTLDDVAASAVEPTPEAQPTSAVVPTATPSATTAAPGTTLDSPAPPSQLPRVDRAIWLGILPVLVLAGLVMLYQLVSRRQS